MLLRLLFTFSTGCTCILYQGASVLLLHIFFMVGVLFIFSLLAPACAAKLFGSRGSVVLF